MAKTVHKKWNEALLSEKKEMIVTQMSMWPSLLFAMSTSACILLESRTSQAIPCQSSTKR